MRNNFFCVLGIIVHLLQSCQGLVHEQQITGDFYLIAVDSENEMSVSYKVNKGGYIAIIPAVVYSVGHDSNYIFAKQHPEGRNGKTNYYIVPIKVSNPYRVEEEVIGPLNENQFYEKLDEFAIMERDNLFQTTIDNL